MLRKLVMSSFEDRVEKEVSRRMDEWYHRRWVEERFDDLTGRINILERKILEGSEVPVECNCKPFD